MNLIMLRHGQTNYNANSLVQGRIDNPLNSTGQEQARALAIRLLNDNIFFDFIASSPLSRALETAYIIKQTLAFNPPIKVYNSFVERDFARFDGKPVSQVIPFVMKPNYQDLCYEDDKELVKRVAKAAFELQTRYPSKTVLLVTHSHVIKALKVFANPNKYLFSDTLDNIEMISFKIFANKITINK